MKLAIITQIRNESKRLREWIDYHYTFYNVDYFLFYLDNPTDDSELILKDLKNKYNIDYKFTEVIGHYQDNNCILAISRQTRSFTEGYNMLKHDYDWIAIFDVDEWIVPNDVEDFDIKKTLSQVKENIYYLPMYNFVPPFDYDKSIINQNFNRWSEQERYDTNHGDCGKSIIRGKIFLDKNFDVEVHFGPCSGEYRSGVNFKSPNNHFVIHQFQSHMIHSRGKYEVFDDRIKRLIEKK